MATLGPGKEVPMVVVTMVGPGKEVPMIVVMMVFSSSQYVPIVVCICRFSGLSTSPKCVMLAENVTWLSL